MRQNSSIPAAPARHSWSRVRSGADPRRVWLKQYVTVTSDIKRTGRKYYEQSVSIRIGYANKKLYTTRCTFILVLIIQRNKSIWV